MTKEITDLMGNIIRMQSTLDNKQKSYDDNMRELRLLDGQIQDLLQNIDLRTQDLSKLLQDSAKQLG